MKFLLSFFLFLILALPAFAQHEDAGPTDTKRSHDYARHIGSRNARRLSTGWTSGHGRRTRHVRDYYRHTRSGRLIHVHSYYRR